MAILKHIASKNADYGEAQRYLIFQYDESTKKPLLDENGHIWTESTVIPLPLIRNASN